MCDRDDTVIYRVITDIDSTVRNMLIKLNC